MIRLKMMAVAAAVVAAALTSGCRDPGQNQAITRNGTITKIDPASRTAVLYFKTKRGEDRFVQGMATDTTKIMIDGRLARLDEVVEGDAATITGVIDVSRGGVVVTQVIITRDVAASAPASAPATSQPAS